MDPVLLFRALAFAAHEHRDQRRKNARRTPYINHLIGVAAALADEGGITEEALLVAAILHDVVEDTDVTLLDLKRAFGADVAALVGELTDDTSLPKKKRKALQVARAARSSPRARQLKIADKLCNVRDVALIPPRDWSRKRRARYVDWAVAVVAGCRGVNPGLERAFDKVVRQARRALARPD